MYTAEYMCIICTDCCYDDIIRTVYLSDLLVVRAQKERSENVLQIFWRKKKAGEAKKNAGGSSGPVSGPSSHQFFFFRMDYRTTVTTLTRYGHNMSMLLLYIHIYDVGIAHNEKQGQIQISAVSHPDSPASAVIYYSSRTGLAASRYHIHIYIHPNQPATTNSNLRQLQPALLHGECQPASQPPAPSLVAHTNILLYCSKLSCTAPPWERNRTQIRVGFYTGANKEERE